MRGLAIAALVAAASGCHHETPVEACNNYRQAACQRVVDCTGVDGGVAGCETESDHLSGTCAQFVAGIPSDCDDLAATTFDQCASTASGESCAQACGMFGCMFECTVICPVVKAAPLVSAIRTAPPRR